MRAHVGHGEDWTERSERGSILLMKLMAWIALRLGREPARLLMVLICLYFVAFADAPRSASRRYLSRVLGRNVGLADIFRHYITFASCVLDRVFLLRDRLDLFDISVHGEEVILDLLRDGSGCFLFGAHFGSFEVVRSMRVLPVNRDAVLLVAAAFLAPLLPLALTLMSLEDLLKRLAGVLF